MSRTSSQPSNQVTSRVWLLARGARRGRSPPRSGSVRPGAETWTQPDSTSWCIPLESGIGPAERRPAPPGILTPDRGQRRTGPAGAAMGTTAPRRSGRRSSRLTNLLRSDDTDARREARRCFGRSDRRAPHGFSLRLRGCRVALRQTELATLPMTTTGGETCHRRRHCTVANPWAADWTRCCSPPTGIPRGCPAGPRLARFGRPRP